MTGVVRETKRRGEIEWHAYSCGIHGVTDLPGCTTIINQKSKPGLETWFKRQGALAAVRQVGAIPSLLETATEDAVVKMLASAADKLRDTAGDMGTRVHEAVEAIVRRQPFEITDDIGPSVEGFRKWANDRKPKVMAAEFMVISEKHRYGATGDLACILDEDLWLIDVKTSTGVYETTALQLAAIRWADHSGKPEDAKPYAVPQATRFGVLHVRPDGTQLVPFGVTEEDFGAFLACRTLYAWDRTRAKEVKGRAA